MYLYITTSLSIMQHSIPEKTFFLFFTDFTIYTIKQIYGLLDTFFGEYKLRQNYLIHHQNFIHTVVLILQEVLEFFNMLI